MPTFAERLKEFREKAGLTQAALAQATGLSLGVVRDYEQGRKEPALRSAFKLAGALGVSVEEFRPEERAAAPKGKPAAEAQADPPPQRKPHKKKPPRPRGG
jgi:transcriptional regulator with XRE-family HTH domain